jgi:hypothetical protein
MKKTTAILGLAITLILSCGEVGSDPSDYTQKSSGSGNPSSSSSGQRRNGVCYIPTIVQGIDISACYEFETDVSSNFCEFYQSEIESKEGFPVEVEWLNTCPSNPKLICPHKNTIAYIYGIYLESFPMTCNEVWENP